MVGSFGHSHRVREVVAAHCYCLPTKLAIAQTFTDMAVPFVRYRESETICGGASLRYTGTATRGWD